MSRKLGTRASPDFEACGGAGRKRSSMCIVGIAGEGATHGGRKRAEQLQLQVQLV